MKILALRFQNLHALVGGHEIDFTRAPLDTGSLFAIVGPTGAGKSTILDAITLALYGRIARYGDGAPAEVMSSGQAECFAEIDFTCRRRTYRARWSQQRARRKADGALQPAKASLCELLDDQPSSVIHEKLREQSEHIARLTGLDYGRFLRSALLAQGAFASFLRASAKDRTELLQKITGTEHYAEYSRRAYEKAKTQQEQLERQRERLTHLPFLNDEERTSLEQQINAKEAEIKKSIEQLSTLTKELQHAEEHQKLTARQQQTQQEFTSLDSLFQQSLNALTQTQNAEKTAQAALNAQLPLLEKAAALDRQLHDNAIQLEKSTAEQKRLQQALVAAQRAAADSEKAWQDVSERLTKAEAYFSEQREMPRLIEKQPQLETHFAAWRHHDRTLISLTEQAKAHALQDEKIAQLGHEAQSYAQKAQASQTQLDQLLPREQEATQRLAQLETAAAEHRTIHGLTTLRHQLTPGHPCPLCGATAHPWAHEIPTEWAQTEAEWKEKLTAAHTARQQLLEQISKIKLDLEKLKTLQSRVLAEQQRLKSEAAARPAQDLNQQQAELETAIANHRHEIQSLSGQLFTDLESAEAWAQQHAKSLNSYQKALTAQQALITEHSARLLAHQQNQQTLQNWLEKNTAALQTIAHLTTERSQHQQARLAFFEGQSVELVRQQWQATVDQARAERQQAEVTHQQLTQQREALRGQLQTLADQLAALPPIGNISLAEQRHAQQLAQQTLHEQQQLLGQLHERWQRDVSARQQHETLARELALCEKEAHVWQQLADLIGSANGDKFARFAQTLTLRRLISLANHHLRDLAPRYRLQAKETEELGLEIVDLFQADHVRSIESLSGGETFLTSLSLALGLSDLASQQTPIDFVFIDEGFGTLDPDTLDIALSALEALRQRGKTIGIISHVEALKERIRPQITVRKTGAGRSQISVEN